MYQKQSSRGVLRKRCSENMQQIYRRAPMKVCFLCIDLIFTNQPNLVVDSGTHRSLYTLYTTIRLFTVRLICKLNIHHLIKDLFGIMLKLVRMPYYLHCKVLIGIVCLLISLFANNNIILSVFKNFVPDKFITCNDTLDKW